MAEDGAPFFLRYIGEVPMFILLSHILFIFATVFFVAMATVHAFRVIGCGEGLAPMAKYLFWAMVCCFMGGYPFGIPMNWYAFGGTWEGVPFGTDATDNKTQLLFVYLVFASLATLGSLTGGKIGRDLFAPKTLGVIGVGSFAVMLFIYLVPHSIQFEPGFTYAFCYTWTGIVAALYVLGLLKSKGSR
jgi:ABC-type Fe3+-siderophore transport system permease subunit